MARRELSGFEKVFAAGAFPAMVVGTTWGTIELIERGVDPLRAFIPFVAFNYLFLAVAEMRMPWHRSWLRNQGDLRTDIGLYFTNIFTGVVLTPPVLIASAALGGWLSQQFGMGLWPLHWPLVAQFALALFVAEFVEYSFHRAMHEIPWLWRFHATHHSAPRLYWLNSVRFHPIDLFLVGAIKMVPLSILGAGLEIFALVNLFSAVHGSFQHANIPVRIGPLNWIFSMTELHRWHHSRRMEEANHNYGGNLILWDIIFGTRWLPKDREPPEDIGMDALPNFPKGLWANLAAPFRWRRVVQEASPVAD